MVEKPYYQAETQSATRYKEEFAAAVARESEDGEVVEVND